MSLMSRVKKLQREAKTIDGGNKVIFCMPAYQNPGHIVVSSGDLVVTYTETEFEEFKKTHKDSRETLINMFPVSKKGLKPWD